MMHARSAFICLARRRSDVKNQAMHLIIQGHPAPDSFSDALADRYALGLGRRGVTSSRICLRELSFDLNLRAGFSGQQQLEPDLQHAQEVLMAADHVAWFFPTWWSAPPALVKGFIDRTFLPGYAFRYDEGQALPVGHFRGRSARVVTTMDSPAFWYRLWYRSSVHSAFDRATLRFVGFSPVHETTIFRQRELSRAARDRWLQKMVSIGEKDAGRSKRQGLDGPVPQVQVSGT